MLIQQRQYEDYDAGETKQSLYDGGGQVADEDAACRVRGEAPAGSCGARLLLALTRAFEVFTEKDACDGTEDEAEQGADAEEESDQGASDAADGTAHGTPVARSEAAGAVRGGDEVGDEGYRGEYEEDYEDCGADGAKVCEQGVDEG